MARKRSQLSTAVTSLRAGAMRLRASSGAHRQRMTQLSSLLVIKYERGVGGGWTSEEEEDDDEDADD